MMCHSLLIPLLLSVLACECAVQPPFALAAVPWENTTFDVLLQLEAPFAMDDAAGTGAVTGFGIELLRRLANDAPFSYDLSYVSTSQQVIQAAQDGLLHFGLGPITVTNDVLVSVAMSHHFVSDGVMCVIQIPQALPSLFSFGDPFHPTCWLMIAIVFVLFALVRGFVDDECSPGDGLVARAGDAWWWSTLNMFGQPDGMPSSLPSRLVSLAYVLFFTIILAAYTANLAAFLATTSLSPTITDYNTIVAGQKVCVVNSTAVVDYVMDTMPSGVLSTFASDTFCYSALRAGNFDAVVDAAVSGLYQLSDPINNNLMEVGKWHNPSGWGIVFPLLGDEKLVNRINYLLLYYQSVDSAFWLQSQFTKWWPPAPPPPQTVNQSGALEANSFYGLVIIVGVLVGVAVIIRAVKMLREKSQKGEEDTPQDSAEEMRSVDDSCAPKVVQEDGSKSISKILEEQLAVNNSTVEFLKERITVLEAQVASKDQRLNDLLDSVARSPEIDVAGH